jgi:hypothetical protein
MGATVRTKLANVARRAAESAIWSRDKALATIAIRTLSLICKRTHARTFVDRSAEAGAGAMLVACRLAGLSALEGHYAGLPPLAPAAI